MCSTAIWMLKASTRLPGIVRAARRGHACRHCGSALFWKADGVDYTSILAGTFDGPTGLKPGYHIFCADKGDFYDIRDDLPRFAEASQ